ncbi:synaptogenesis protein syg-2-like isoform X2 [Planococcus citri]|uniref:synaptogenesis protein syg-2-like isoform X2 n=1 Tax=Planococcus citri TaxID=170843 RepID=UPI0031F737B6
MKLTNLNYLLFTFIYVQATKQIERQEASDDDDVSDETHSIQAVLGKTANLPCDIESRDKQNVVYMVLWFRKNDDKPIYSFDARGRATGKELHWSDERSLGPRAYFVTLSRPASLQLDNVQLRDEGTYRCRVDYRNAPTKNFQIHLTVIVPPHQIILYDNSGREVQNIVGPLQENADMTLVCEVRGGKPIPTIVWTSKGIVLQNQTKTVESNIVTSKLEIKNLSRTDYDTIYKCKASNTNLILPTERRIQLKLHLRPLYAKILKKYREMIADNEYQLTCETSGSRPPAIITWWSGDSLLNYTQSYLNSSETTVTIHTITFEPKPRHNNMPIKCLAVNPKTYNFTREDSFKLNIVYPPMVMLQLGNKLDSNHIKESDDVYFECKIQANPPEYKITWFHDNTQINQNISSGVILSGQSLVLQSVSRHNSGSYKCLVANNRGETFSQPVHLRVKYVPVCRNQETLILGASLGEIVHVVCSVMADPNIISFKWVFNNSAQTLVVPREKYVIINSTTSELGYKLTSNKDFGTLTCWTKNAIGEQTQPCTFYVIRAVRPNTVNNCTFQTIAKNDQQLLEIRCYPGYNGGLSQQFHLEIMRKNYTLVNLSVAETPSFHVDLSKFIGEWQSDLQFVIYASNAKGRSESTVFDNQLPNDLREKIAQLTMSQQKKTQKEMIALSIIVTFFLAVTATASFFIVFLVKRSCILKQTSSCTQSKHNKAKLKLNTDNTDEKFIISYQLKTNKPDILNKVVDDTTTATAIKSTNSRRCTDVLGDTFSNTLYHSKSDNLFNENQMVPKQQEYDTVLSKVDDKCSLLVTTLTSSAKNQHKVHKKIENVSSSKLTDTIFGPESSV